MTDNGAISKILTLVFTDLADSTALKTQHGDVAAGDLISRHRSHVTSLAEDCRGRVIDWAGDGCFLTFDTSSAAVTFALRLQQAHADESELPDVRIGIHMGEITEKAGPGEAPRIEGLAVDIAARVSGLANPGQVLMSAAVYDSARQRLGVEALGQPVLWQTHGAYTLKGFDNPLDIGEAKVEGIAPLEAPAASEKAYPVVATTRIDDARVEIIPPPGRRRPFVPALIALIVLAGLLAGYWIGRSGSDGPTGIELGPITSLAVLPLDNLSNDPDQDYFADGMTEAITAELAKIKALAVRGRTSAMRFKGSGLSIPEIATALNVDALIEGSVLRDGDDVRITVQLVHGPTDTHLWAETYTETITSVLKLQSDVALAIADALNAELTGEERARIGRARSVDPAAHEAYLLGKHFIEVKTKEGIRAAVQYLEQATEIDPGFGEAWAKLGAAYDSYSGWGIEDSTDWIPKARAAFQRALELDATLAEAHLGLASISYSNDREWEQAEERFRRALELSPNNARAHIGYGWYLAIVGRTDQAAQSALAGLEIDPDDPGVVRDAAHLINVAGQPDRARIMLEELLEADPAFIPAMDSLIEVFRSLHMLPEAVEIAERWVELTNRSADVLPVLVGVLAAAGRVSEAGKVLEETLQSSEYFERASLGWAYVNLGELDAAFEAFEQGYERRDWMMVYLRKFPYRVDRIDRHEFIAFRTDSRYWDLVERMGFPPLPPEHPGYAEEQAWLARKAAAEETNAPIKKIAVLPFDNMSSDPEQEYFVDGMTEALIGELAKVKSIKVISRTSVMQYKDTDKSLPEIARELGVDALVEGSVMKAGNEVRITAQLVHGITDEHLWADSYTNTLENVFKLQAEVALAITDEINAVVTPDERARIAVVESSNLEAYELYVRGRDFWSLRTEEALQQARRLFERALELDENFALAHVGLADAYLMLFDYGYLPRDDAYRNAGEQIERALAIDPELGEAYTSLGMFKMLLDWNWEEAEESYRKGIELNPGHATGHQWYGHFLRTQLRHEEQLAQTRAAHELDPASPIIGIWVVQSLADVGRYDEALEMAEGLRTLHPGLPRIREGFFTILTLAGRFEDALTYYESPMASDDDTSTYYTEKAYLLAVTGKDSEARRILNDFIERVGPEEAHYNLLSIAAAYTALGERDEALAWIEKGYDIRYALMTDILSNVELRLLYDEPRFQAVIQKMNLPDPRDVN